MTNLLNPAFAWVCKFMGHKWRRLHKAEWSRGVPIQFEPGSDAQVRICGRCQAYRLAKKRIPKGATT